MAAARIPDFTQAAQHIGHAANELQTQFQLLNQVPAVQLNQIQAQLQAINQQLQQMNQNFQALRTEIRSL